MAYVSAGIIIYKYKSRRRQWSEMKIVAKVVFFLQREIAWNDKTGS
ncbi:hypothetical protein CIT292_06600 [Citrobacter youngae ATCC 29220]|uniref:Uncharacterized protein n=1 Tax=Citrobacter youngae ATCC 29220 TaxID=500640 RepID=D4B7S5_9ENTR|nr:hypothetical protein CIT292_06600 [Citrobacter youngae ATCC 29220]